jgi:hypothetical protein
MDKKVVYKVLFTNQGKVYEIYAKEIFQSHLFGFIEAEELVFRQSPSVVVDPNEERLRHEFTDVTRTYIPLQSILRIDEVEREGVAKVSDAPKGHNNVMPFPTVLYSQNE